MFSGVFGYVIFTGRTTVTGHDGITQYYSGFVASYRIYREFLASLFSGKGPELKMWDFCIGFGDDTITALNMYGFADPFGLISVFFPERLLGRVFTFVYFVKSYLSGLGFILFARYHKAGRFGALTGAMIYIFSIFPVMFGSSECNFMIPILCLPYMLLGSDLILDKGKPLMLIISTALISSVNFYFLYMAVMAAVFYTLFRYFTEVRQVKAADVVKTFIRFFLSYAEALLLSAFILLPVIMQLFTANRYSESKEVALIYDGAHYFRFLSGFLGYTNVSNWTVMGYGAAAFLSVVLMFSLKGKYTRSKTIFIMITLGLLIPLCGFAMTAFAYTNNRWVFIYDLAVSYIVSRLLYEFEWAEKREFTILFAVTGIYLLFSAILPMERHENQYLTSLCLCLSLCLIIVLKVLKPGSTYVLRGAVLICACAGVMLNSYFQFMGYGDDDGALEDMYLPSQLDSFRNGYGIDELIDDKDLSYRVDETYFKETRNSGQLRGTMTTGMYYSLINPHHAEFYLKNGVLCNHTWNSMGLDSRSILNAISSVKYYVVKDGSEKKIPFDFLDTKKEAELDGTHVKLYENEAPLPLGYAYPAYISVEKYESLPVYQRQEAFLYGAVSDAKGVPEAEFKPLSKSVLRDIDWGEDIEGDLSALKVKKDGAEAVFKLNSSEEAEVYAVFTDMDFHATSRRGQFDALEWAQLSRKERMGVIVDDLTREAVITTYLVADLNGERVSDFRYGNRRYQYYCGQRDFVMKLGTVGLNDGDELRIKFSSAGDYQFDSIDVVALPVRSIREKKETLRASTMTDIQQGTNTFSGRISLETPSVVTMAIPLSAGWRAYVDGEETPLVSVNTFYMGVEADAGEHLIELYYRTPGLSAGVILSISGLVILVIMCIKKFTFKV